MSKRRNCGCNNGRVMGDFDQNRRRCDNDRVMGDFGRNRKHRNNDRVMGDFDRNRKHRDNDRVMGDFDRGRNSRDNNPGRNCTKCTIEIVNPSNIGGCCNLGTRCGNCRRRY